jgi:hypothetical protein
MSRASSLFLVVLGGLVACGGGGNGDDAPDGAPADASPACAEATTYQDFTRIQANIFVRQCSFMDCHDASSPESMMDLTAANARDLLVNVDARLMIAQGFKRVVPGSPSTSYLMIILGDEAVPPKYPGPIDTDIGTMPQNSPLLCKEKRDAIERWIVAGALDD